MTRPQISSLFLYDRNKTDFTLEAFSSENGKDGKQSELFGIFEVSQKGPVVEKFLASFINVLERAHDNADFEYILEQANAHLSTFSLTEDSEDKAPKISAFLGFMEGETISFAAFGEMRVLLLSAQSNKSKTTWKATDVLDVSEKDASSFSQILSGEISKGNMLLASTSTVFDVLSLEYIKKTITSLPAESAISQLEQSLSRLPSNLPFAAFILALPSQAPALEKKEIIPEKPQIKVEKSQALAAGVVLYKTLKFILQMAARLCSALLRIIIKATLQAFNLLQKTRKTKKELSYLTRPGLVSRKIKMPALSKKLLGLFLIIFLIFIWGIAISQQKAGKNKLIEQYNEKISLADEKYNQALASLIYENEEKAKKQLLEAQSILKDLPQIKEKKEQEQKREGLLKKTDAELEKLRRLATILSPKSLVKLSNFENAGWFFLDNGEFLVFSSESAVKINPSSPESSEKFDLKTGDEKILKIVSRNPDRLLLLTDKNSLKEFDLKEKKINSLKFSLPAGQSIQDLAVYNQRLYILDPNSNQIWRYTSAKDGFEQGSQWLQEEGIDIKKSRSISIDGSIYLTDGQGEIQKFDLGKKSEFSVIIDPSPALITKIWTNPDSKFLYLLDPSSKRLVVISKEEKNVVTQYTSEQFRGLQDFLIDEASKKIYLLTSKEILEIEAKHL